MISRRSLIASGLSVVALGAAGYALWPRLGRYQEEVVHQRRPLPGDPSMRDLIRMATLAANGHNAQPWTFELGDEAIRILPDMSRRTDVVDPDDHHLYVSLGCAAENLDVAASARGRTTHMTIETGAETSIDISLAEGPVENEDLYQAIPLRQSTRAAYDGRPVSTADIALLEAAAKEEGVSLLIFTDASDKEAITEFVVRGNGAQMADPAFIAELRHWLRFSPRQALATRDGLFAACSGNPVMPGPVGELLFSAFFTPDSENEKYREHIRSSAGIAVFVGDRADPGHWIRVGRSFQRFALKATTLGIRNAHINQPLEVASLRPEFARWLGQPDARPDLIVRFGRAPALPMSLRRPVPDVVA